MTQTPTDRVRAALDAPEDMVDADLMFCLQDYQHLPYETVKAIALSVCKVIATRNREALSELEGNVLVPVEPTLAMRSSAEHRSYRDEKNLYEGIYRAMIEPYVKGEKE